MITINTLWENITEDFVVMWLLYYIEHLIGIRQYGGLTANSITHYLIEFLNFILSNQESKGSTAILACLIDFSKAFNLQNHNILITKLSDMNVPAWLLRIGLTGPWWSDIGGPPPHPDHSLVEAPVHPPWSAVIATLGPTDKLSAEDRSWLYYWLIPTKPHPPHNTHPPRCICFKIAISCWNNSLRPQSPPP